MMKNEFIQITRLNLIVCLLMILTFIDIKGSDKLNWQMQKGGNLFSFLTPMELKKQTIRGPSSKVGLYSNENIYLSFAIGGNLESMKGKELAEYKEKTLKIDDRVAKLISYKNETSKEFNYHVEVYFENILIDTTAKS